MHLNIRRHIEGALAEGRGTQLLWLFCIIVISFFSLWGISILSFGANAFTWQEIIALCLDPGVFGGPGTHDGFRLLITFVGIILFAATLISIFSNIFENISEQYRKGESRFHFKNFILIIGSNKILKGLLLYISDDEQKNKYGDRHIVIMADRPIEELRDELEASINNKNLLKRVTLYYDKRDNLENLKRAYIKDADYIFVIGEDEKEKHDVLNLMCLSYIRNVQINPKSECIVIMNSQTTMKAYQNFISGTEFTGSLFLMNGKNNNEYIVNINECKAEYFIENTAIEKFKGPDNKPISVVILGMTSTGRAIASTLAYYCHFKNRRKIIISFFDSNIEEKTDDFIARNYMLFDKCRIGRNETLGPDYKALEDVFFNFIDMHPSSPAFIEKLTPLLHDTENLVCVCYDDIRKNLATEINLRNRVKGINVYADFSEYDDSFKMMGGEEQNLSKRTSKGFGCNSNPVDYYSYVFDIRKEGGFEFFKKDTEETERKWEKLSFAEKQKYIYKSNVQRFSDKFKTSGCNSAEDGIDLNLCFDFISYMMFIGKEGDGSLVYIPNNPDYMKIIWQHFTRIDELGLQCEHGLPVSKLCDDEESTYQDFKRVQYYYTKSLVSKEIF